MDVTVQHNDELDRYEARLDGQLLGQLDYRLDGDRIVVFHTVVEDAFEGQGIGSRLAAGALDDVRARGLQVVATCSFIKGYIERHDAYQDLLAS